MICRYGISWSYSFCQIIFYRISDNDHIFYFIVNKGCPGGDKSVWCRQNIRTESDKKKCYLPRNADLCCSTCLKYYIANIPGKTSSMYVVHNA